MVEDATTVAASSERAGQEAAAATLLDIVEVRRVLASSCAFVLVLVLGTGTLPMQGATQEPFRSWIQVAGAHWQLADFPTESMSQTDADEKTSWTCVKGMVDVEGAMKVEGQESIEALQEAACIEWLEYRCPEIQSRVAWRSVGRHCGCARRALRGVSRGTARPTLRAPPDGMSPETAQIVGSASGAGAAVMFPLRAGAFGGWYSRRRLAGA